MALPWLGHPKPDLNELLNLTSPILDLTKYRTRLFGDFLFVILYLESTARLIACRSMTKSRNKIEKGDRVKKAPERM